MKLNNRLTGRRIGAAVVLAAAILAIPSTALAATAGTQQQAASQTAGVAQVAAAPSATQSPAVIPLTGPECTGILTAYYHGYTALQGTICYTTAAAPNKHAAGVACIAAMSLTRTVEGGRTDVPVATIACGAAITEG